MTALHARSSRSPIDCYGIFTAQGMSDVAPKADADLKLQTSEKCCYIREVMPDILSRIAALGGSVLQQSTSHM
jgi:hypothetical protein